MKIEIIDNFLNGEDFNQFSNLNLITAKPFEIKIYHNSIIDKKIIVNDCLSEKFLIKLNNDYHQTALNILNKLCPEKTSLYEYSEFHLIETGKDYKYPIHDDTPNKLLSGVIYLKPEKNLGTIFYKDKKGNKKKIVDWKENRAVFFSRKERNSWHSYEGDGKNNRLTLVYNLMTNKIKNVYQIEQSSYIIGNIRYKLNPYLYR